jgi:hypothetical protein
MMDAARTSETSVTFYHTTRRNNPEDSHLQLIYPPPCMYRFPLFNLRASSIKKKNADILGQLFQWGHQYEAKFTGGRIEKVVPLTGKESCSGL